MRIGWKFYQMAANRFAPRPALLRRVFTACLEQTHSLRRMSTFIKLNAQVELKRSTNVKHECGVD
eukprot:6084836-Amphidinium_carterae.1